MDHLRAKFRALWQRLIRRRRFQDHFEADFDAELASHLSMHIEDGVRKGLSAEEARRQALIKLGGQEQTRQAYRERATLHPIESVLQDIHFAIRQLRKSPGFALVTILTLALGIGANTTMFSLVNGVLLNGLPYPHPGELVTVDASKANFEQGSISYPNFRDWQRSNRTFAQLAVARQTSFILTGAGEAERLRGDFVSSDFFPILGVRPELGRL